MKKTIIIILAILIIVISSSCTTIFGKITDINNSFIDKNVTSEEKEEDHFILNNRITGFFEPQNRFNQYKRYWIVEEALEERRGIVLATAEFLILKKYQSNLDFIFVPMDNCDEILSLYEDGDDFVIGLKSEEPILTEEYHYLAHFTNYIHSKKNNHYYYELLRVNKNSSNLRSKFRFITYNMKYNDVKIINEATDLSVADYSEWNLGEIITFGEIDYIFKLSNSPVL